MNKKVSGDKRKLRLARRIVDVAHRHGLFVSVFDGPEEMVSFIEDQRLGKQVREAIEAERLRLDGEQAAAATTRH